MTVQTITVPFLDETGARDAFDSAYQIAREFRAHIKAMHIWQDAQIPATGHHPYEIYIAPDIDAYNTRAKDVAQTLRDCHRERCQMHDVKITLPTDHHAAEGATSSWMAISGDLPGDLGRACRLSDLTVMAKPDDKRSIRSLAFVEEVIFQSARPIILVGETPLGAYPGKVALAWNRSREAARALTSSLDILKRAETVLVLSVGDELPTGIDHQQAADYLRLHGVAATAERVAAEKDIENDDLLLKTLDARGIQFVVMGAYSRSRFREAILGGATRNMLEQTTLPVLLAH